MFMANLFRCSDNERGSVLTVQRGYDKVAASSLTNERHD
jgi:hypothetical protein